jgi:hypothetical protein
MRTLFLGQQFVGEDLGEFIKRSFRTLEESSQEDAMVIADGYTVENFTETRTLNANTANATQVANFLATFIRDLQKRSINRVE